MLTEKDVFSSSYGYKDNMEKYFVGQEGLCIREGQGRVHGAFWRKV